MAARPKSKVAQENLDIFRDAWINQVRILTDAVDDITTIDDFLAVSENHILDDVNNCVAACQVLVLVRFNFIRVVLDGSPVKQDGPPDFPDTFIDQPGGIDELISFDFPHLISLAEQLNISLDLF